MSKTVDLHIDGPWAFTKKRESQATPEKREAGGLDIPVWSLYLHHNYIELVGGDRAAEEIRNQIAAFKGQAFGVEGGHLLGKYSPNTEHFPSLSEYAGFGVRYVTLCHNQNNLLCGSATDTSKGLTKLGQCVITLCNVFGILVDVSHASDETVYDVLGVNSKPTVATHSGCRALVNHPRNLTDNQIKAIAETGGLVGIPFVKNFVGAALECVANHIDHAVSLIGHQHVAIGSDLDGAVLCDGITDASMWRDVVMERLIRLGYTQEAIDAIAGGNAITLFRL